MRKPACLREVGSVMKLPATSVLMSGGLNGCGRGTRVTSTPCKSCLIHSTVRKKTTSLPVITREEHFEAEHEEDQCPYSVITNTQVQVQAQPTGQKPQQQQIRGPRCQFQQFTSSFWKPDCEFPQPNNCFQFIFTSRPALDLVPIFNSVQRATASFYTPWQL